MSREKIIFVLARNNANRRRLESVLRCEHKSRNPRLQAEVTPELTTRFEEVDPHDEDEISSIERARPYWPKPIRSFTGHLGFGVADDGDHLYSLRDEAVAALPLAMEEV